MAVNHAKKFIKAHKEHFTPGRARYIEVVVAHWQSIVANDKTSRCSCCKKKNSPVCSLRNRRQRNRKERTYGDMRFTNHTCQDCVSNIQKELGVEFKYDYCP